MSGAFSNPLLLEGQIQGGIAQGGDIREVGAVGALSATINAVCGALQVAGIRHLDMPATPMRVRQALSEADVQPRRRA